MVDTVWTKTGLKCLDTVEVASTTSATSMIINTNHDSANNILTGVGSVMVSGALYPTTSTGTSQHYLLWQMSSFFPNNGFSGLSLKYRTQPWLSLSGFGSQSRVDAILGNVGNNAQKFGTPITFQMFIYAQGTLGTSAFPNQRYAQGVCNYSYIPQSGTQVMGGRMSVQLPFTTSLRQIKFYYNSGSIRGKIKCWALTNNS